MPTPEQTPVSASSDVTEQLVGDLQPLALLILRHQTPLARQLLTNYLKAHPDDSQATFLLGLSYHREQKYGQAMPYFDRALELKPTYMPVNHFRGWALYYLGDLDAARHAFDEFLELKPDEPDSLFGLGLIDLAEGDLDAAEHRFQKSIDIWQAMGDKADRKSISKAHTRLSEVYEQRGDLEQAKAHLEIATALYPDHYEAFYKLSRILRRLGENEAAEHAHQEYLAGRDRLHPRLPGAPSTSFPE